MKINASITTLLLFSNLSSANCFDNQCRDVTVSTLYLTTSGGGKAIIGTSGDESKLACDAGPKGYLTIDSNDDNYDAIYSLLLSSHVTQTPLQIRTAESDSCKIIYVVSRE